jgi:hypothetical protein
MLKQFSGKDLSRRKSKMLATGSNIQSLPCKHHASGGDGLRFTATKE